MRRTLILLTVYTFVISGLFCQNVGINQTGAPAHPSSILDLTSTNQGFLPPRMTTAQRNAIPAPAEGLMIYNLDCKDINFYNGTTWISMLLQSPAAISATGSGSTSFNAVWTAVAGATAYFIDVSTSATFATFLPGYNNLNVGLVTTFNVTGLTCGTTYFFRVRAQSACGTSSSSNTLSVIPACCISNYTATAIPFAPLTGAQTNVVLGDDQVSGAIPIGFTFSFYCVDYTNAYISSNGFITFNAASGSGCCSGQILPTAGDPSNLIACGWDDLFPPGAGTVGYFTTGVAPNRRFVVNYTNIPYCCGSGPPNNTMQIILYETTNIIEVHNASITNITPGTIGVENGAGTIGTAPPGRNSGAWTSVNEAWRFN